VPPGANAAVSLVDADADFADLLAPGDLDRARRELMMRSVTIPAGRWDGALGDGAPHKHGFLGVEGLVVRTVDVLGRRCAELVGPGEVARPWVWDDEGSHVQAEIAWDVLEPTRLGVIDGPLLRRLAPWPAVAVELFTRGIRRAHHLSVALAISYHPRVDDRLRLTLWHLAERYGHVGPDGIVVHLPLAHKRLALLVGAHRPSVTAALGSLTRAGALTRRDNGNWVLLGDPPAEMQGHRLSR
jgi:hypothetical protein